MCVLNSCQWQKRGGSALPMELVQAENIMYENPDSALHILQEMEMPKEEEAHATWALLLTLAKYKCDIVQSDSLVNWAYNYFKDNENIQKKALVLFCKAALYEEQNRLEEALKFYLDGASVVENTTDYRLAHLIHVRLGLLYAFRDLYDYAIEYCEKANNFAILSKDTYYITNSYNNLARVYSVQEKYEKAIDFYDKAIEVGNAYKEIKALNFALQEKAGIYIRLKKYDEALFLMKKIETSQLTLPGFQILGHLYSKIHEEDSAYYYLDKALLTNDIYVLRSAYQVLFNLSKETNNYKKNAEYSIKLWSINDSINKIDRDKVLTILR